MWKSSLYCCTPCVVFLCLSFSFFKHTFLDAHTKEQVRGVRFITRCSITNTLRAFCLVGFNGSEHKANCTAVCGAAGTMHLELVGWEHVKELFVLFHTMCCIFYVCPFLFPFFQHTFLDAHTKEQVRGVRFITRCSITNTLRAFCLVGFNGSEHKANCTAVCGAAGTMHLELVGWEHVKELFVLFHTMCCIFMFVLFFFFFWTYFFGCTY